MQLKEVKQKLRNSKMANTEKPSTKAEQKKQGILKNPKMKKENLKSIPGQEPKVELKTEEEKDQTKNPDSQTSQKSEEKKKVPTKKVKKSEVVVNANNVPVSTKYSISICKFIKHKKISKAISDLKEVIAKKKAVPMKGEIPHRKGKRMMSGRFPKDASGYFIILLKSLLGNANNHEMENPVITECIANMASRPYGRFGAVRRKRTHIILKAKEKKMINKEKKTKGEKK